MTRALAVLVAVALLLLGGCASSQAQPAAPDDAFAVVDDALTATRAAIIAGHDILAALHEAERARIEAAAPDAETGHRQIEALRVRMLPAWDLYEAFAAAYTLGKATVETARAARAAGRPPDALLLGQVIVRLAIAAEAFWRAVGEIGGPRPGAAMTSPPHPGAAAARAT